MSNTHVDANQLGHPPREHHRFAHPRVLHNVHHPPHRASYDREADWCHSPHNEHDMMNTWPLTHVRPAPSVTHASVSPSPPPPPVMTRTTSTTSSSAAHVLVHTDRIHSHIPLVMPDTKVHRNNNDDNTPHMSSHTNRQHTIDHNYTWIRSSSSSSPTQSVPHLALPDPHAAHPFRATAEHTGAAPHIGPQPHSRVSCNHPCTPAHEEHVHVIVRVRPPLPRECAANAIPHNSAHAPIQAAHFSSAVLLSPRHPHCVTLCETTTTPTLSAPVGSSQRDEPYSYTSPVYTSVTASSSAPAPAAPAAAAAPHEVSSRQRFAFDAVLGPRTSQRRLYETSVRPAVQSVLAGFHATVMAYGQTGTGKTYTMEGVGTRAQRGVIARAVEELFASVSLRPRGGGDEEEVYGGIAVSRQGYGANRIDEQKKCSRRVLPLRSAPRVSSSHRFWNDGAYNMYYEEEDDDEHDEHEHVEEDDIYAEDSEVEVTSGLPIRLWVSYMQIYNETLSDLLAQPAHREHFTAYPSSSFSSRGFATQSSASARPPGGMDKDEVCAVNYAPHKGSEGANTTTLSIRHGRDGDVAVAGLTQWRVRSPHDVYALMARGTAQRQTASTRLSPLSSRSHAIFTVTVERVIAETDETEQEDGMATRTTEEGNAIRLEQQQQQQQQQQQKVCKGDALHEPNQSPLFVEPNDRTQQSAHIVPSRVNHASVAPRRWRRARLHIVDLAGSENVRQSRVSGLRLQETRTINKSLHELGNVMAALARCANGRPCHVPFRNSLLTSALRDSLGGHGRLVLIACVSPAPACYAETLSTLQFAARARRVRHRVTLSADADAMSELPHGDENGELAAMRTRLRQYEQTIVTLQRQLGNVQKREYLAGGAQQDCKVDSHYRGRDDTTTSSRDVDEEDESIFAKVRARHGMSNGSDCITNASMINSSRVGEYDDGDEQTSNEHASMPLAPGGARTRQLASAGGFPTNQEEDRQTHRYKQLLVKQRDLLISLTTRLRERDEMILRLQDEIDAHDAHVAELERALDKERASCVVSVGANRGVHDAKKVLANETRCTTAMAEATHAPHCSSCDETSEKEDADVETTMRESTLSTLSLSLMSASPAWTTSSLQARRAGSELAQLRQALRAHDQDRATLQRILEQRVGVKMQRLCDTLERMAQRGGDATDAVTDASRVDTYADMLHEARSAHHIVLAASRAIAQHLP